MGFIKATKKQAKLRLAVFGPSGSGKTFSALRIAKGMGGKIAVIDSERGSASKYSDRFDFDVMELSPCKIDSLIPAIEEASELKYDILIIDSLTHSWQELLEEIDKLAKAKYGNNTWAAWSDGTPKQKKLISAILNFPGHIIATMRSKTEWTFEQDNRGKNKPVRVGLNPEAGKGIEYEFDMLMEISPEHFVTIIKDRTGMFQDKIIEKPNEKFGRQLIDWLNSGEKVEIKEEQKQIEKQDEEKEIVSDEDKKNLVKDAKKREFPEDSLAWLKDEITKDISKKYYEKLLNKIQEYPLKKKENIIQEAVNSSTLIEDSDKEPNFEIPDIPDPALPAGVL